MKQKEKNEVVKSESERSLHLKNKIWFSVDGFKKDLEGSETVDELTLENCFFFGNPKTEYLAQIQWGNLRKLSILCVSIDPHDLISFFIGFLSNNNKLTTLKVHLTGSRLGDVDIQPLIETLKKFNFRLLEVDFNGYRVSSDLKKILERNNKILAVVRQGLGLQSVIDLRSPSLDRLLRDFQNILNSVELLNDLDQSIKKIALNGLDELIVSVANLCYLEEFSGKTDDESLLQLTCLVLPALKSIREESPQRANAIKQMTLLTECAEDTCRRGVKRISSSVDSFVPSDKQMGDLKKDLQKIIQNMTVETAAVQFEVMHTKIIFSLDQFSLAFLDSSQNNLLEKMDENPKYVALKGLQDAVFKMYKKLNTNTEDGEESCDNSAEKMTPSKTGMAQDLYGDQKRQETELIAQNKTDREAGKILASGTTGNPAFSQNPSTGSRNSTSMGRDTDSTDSGLKRPPPEAI